MEAEEVKGQGRGGAVAADKGEEVEVGEVLLFDWEAEHGEEGGAGGGGEEIRDWGRREGLGQGVCGGGS